MQPSAGISTSVVGYLVLPSYLLLASRLGSRRQRLVGSVGTVFVALEQKRVGVNVLAGSVLNSLVDFVLAV